MMKTFANIFAGSAWFMIAVWCIYALFAPTGLWLTYEGLIITDAVAGSDPAGVEFKVEYHSTFLIRWHRTLLRLQGENDWIPVCAGDGEGERYPGYVNVKTTIDALFDRECAKNLAPGEYYIEDDMEWDDIVRRSIVVESNVFRVDAAAAARSRPQPPAAPKARHVRRRQAPPLPWPLRMFFR